MAEYDGTAEKREDEKTDAPRTQEGWIAELNNAAQDTRNFRTAGHRINARYLDIRDGVGSDDASRYNLFTTNTNILQAVLYSRQPEPYVDREHQDADDDIARIASEMLVRILKVQDKSDMDAAIAGAVQDRLVPGIGQMWLRYCADIEHCVVPAVLTQEGVTLVEGFEYDRVTKESVVTDYVYWDDFFWSPARTWCEVSWVARRLWMTRDEVTKRWGKEKADRVSYGKGRITDKSASDSGKRDKKQYAQVFEIWCKTSKKVYWISKGADEILETADDPLKLTNFWPCPPPLRGIHSTSTVIPRADYTMVQDQYEQLDTVNSRIALLVDTVRVVGAYDKNNEELRGVIGGKNNAMIPVDNWALFAEKGGIKGTVDWFPLDQIVAAIDKLRQYRADLVSQIYELTGMSDIIRGATKASETATAQEIKAQFASMRLQAVQMDIGRFIEAALQIKAEIMGRKYSDESFIVQSNMEWVPEPMKGQLFPEAIKLLRMPNLMKFRIRISTDALAVPDFNAERDAKVMFLRTFGSFMEQATPMIQSMPGAAPFLLKMVQWAASGFRASASIEGVIDQAIRELEKQLAAPKPPPPPTPEQIKAQNEQAKGQQEAQQRQQEFAMDMAGMQQEHQVNTRELLMKDQMNQREFRRKMAEDAMELIKPKKESRA